MGHKILQQPVSYGSVPKKGMSEYVLEFKAREGNTRVKFVQDDLWSKIRENQVERSVVSWLDSSK